MNENSPPQIQQALAECIAGALFAEQKAGDYLKLSQGEADDSIYEACRSMHRFYSSMHEFFLEEERAISALVKSDCEDIHSQMAA